jgi:uncharacterized protein YjfI (DUF2170 family)
MTIITNIETNDAVQQAEMRSLSEAELDAVVGGGAKVMVTSMTFGDQQLVIVATAKDSSVHWSSSRSGL